MALLLDINTFTDKIQQVCVKSTQCTNTILGPTSVHGKVEAELHVLVGELANTYVVGFSIHLKHCCALKYNL